MLINFTMRKPHKKYEEMNKMCDLCNSYPHLPGCPNAPEPKGLTRCDECGEPIYDGEEYVEVDGYMYHETCLEVMPVRDILEALGHEVRTMEDEYE